MLGKRCRQNFGQSFGQSFDQRAVAVLLEQEGQMTAKSPPTRL
jgi:hypothetical protein